jgi:lipopolysaccharide transport system ATP-binding protein
MTNSDVVIPVEGLSKKYSLHHEHSERYTSLRDVVTCRAKVAGRRLLNPFTLSGQLRVAQHQAGQSQDEEFWALKDVNFEICRGERVGLSAAMGRVRARC